MLKYFLIILLLANSCELIVIGKKPIEVKTVIVSRDNPTGTVLLFKAEINANNIKAATDFIASPNGHRLRAIDKLDIYDDLPRYHNILKKANTITNIYEEKLANDIIRINVELDYIRNLTCDTKKINDIYYIVNFGYTKTLY
jgi:hypothetical protein